MRQHLYRGKRVDNGEWIEGWVQPFTNGGYIGLDDRLCIVNGIYATDIYEVIPETVGEWTGLTDKNGKKIFEGYIVQGEAEEARGIVEWQQAECRYLINIRNGYDWLFMDDDEWRVIGNIHDDPELLEGK